MKYIDWWSLVHFVAGFIIAAIASLIESTWLPFVAVVVIGAAWELYEWKAGEYAALESKMLENFAFAAIDLLFDVLGAGALVLLIRLI